MAWPPTLAELKSDMGIDDDRDDVVLQRELDAAVAYVVAEKTDLDGWFEPTDVIALGALRQVGRWHTRRRSPDGVVAMGEMGTGRVPTFDVDIEKLLGIGRFRPPMAM